MTPVKVKRKAASLLHHSQLLLLSRVPLFHSVLCGRVQEEEDAVDTRALRHIRVILRMRFVCQNAREVTLLSVDGMSFVVKWREQIG